MGKSNVFTKRTDSQLEGLGASKLIYFSALSRAVIKPANAMYEALVIKYMPRKLMHIKCRNDLQN
jgi:hypothetical protein